MQTRNFSAVKQIGFVSLAAIAFVAAGCAPAPAVQEARQTATLAPETYTPNTDAGIPVKVAEPARIQGLVASNSSRFRRRSDPFGLNGAESGFDVSQTTERFVQQGGNMETMYEVPPQVDDTVNLEPQPHRRLAGVLVGDSVLAIIDMNDGQAPRIIRPGEQIPNSEWYVVSIDGDKAVLRRKGNVKPTQITVYLESGGDTSGLQSGQGAPGPGGPGGPGGRTITPSGAGNQSGGK